MSRKDCRFEKLYAARSSSTLAYGRATPCFFASRNASSGSTVPSICRCNSALGSPFRYPDAEFMKRVPPRVRATPGPFPGMFATAVPLSLGSVAMGQLTTHVLDISAGLPAAGLQIELHEWLADAAP